MSLVDDTKLVDELCALGLHSDDIVATNSILMRGRRTTVLAMLRHIDAHHVPPTTEFSVDVAAASRLLREIATMGPGVMQETVELANRLDAHLKTAPSPRSPAREVAHRFVCYGRVWCSQFEAHSRECDRLTELLEDDRSLAPETSMETQGLRTALKREIERAERVRDNPAASDENQNIAIGAICALKRVEDVSLQPSGISVLHNVDDRVDRSPAAVARTKEFDRKTFIEWVLHWVGNANRERFAVAFEDELSKQEDAVTARSSNYIADDDTYPTVVTFANGRRVSLANENGVTFLTVVRAASGEPKPVFVR